MFKTKCSPWAINGLMSQLKSDRQKMKIIQQMGFGKLQFVQCTNLRHIFIKELLETFDTDVPSLGGHKITDEDVGRTLGIPVGGLPVPENLDSAKLSPYIKYKDIRLPDLKNDLLRPLKGGDDVEFKELFLIVILIIFMCPTYDNKLDHRLLSSLSVASTASEYNWAKYALDWLVTGVKRYRKHKMEGPGIYFEGSLYFIELFYLNQMLPVDVLGDKPLCYYWTKERIAYALKKIEEKKTEKNEIVLDVTPLKTKIFQDVQREASRMTGTASRELYSPIDGALEISLEPLDKTRSTPTNGARPSSFGVPFSSCVDIYHEVPLSSPCAPTETLSPLPEPLPSSPIVLPSSCLVPTSAATQSSPLRAHKVMKRKERSWEHGQKIKALKGACDGLKSDIYATLKYFLLEGSQGVAGGAARVICRPLDGGDENGCVLQENKGNLSSDRGAPLSLPVSVIDTGKCVHVGSAEWSGQLEKQRQKLASSMETLNRICCQELEADWVQVVKPKQLEQNYDVSCRSEGTSSLLPEDTGSKNTEDFVESIIAEEKKLRDDYERYCLHTTTCEKALELLNDEETAIRQYILEMQGTLDVESSQCLYNDCGKEVILNLIASKEDSAASLFCNMTPHTQEPNLSFTSDIVGVVALLGTVRTMQISRILSDYLGEDQMLAVICKSRATADALAKYEANGSSGNSLYALATSLGKSIKGRFVVICLEDIRPYPGGLIDIDGKRVLNLPSPTFGELPLGFLGYAVNMIDIEGGRDSVFSLRETLFYRLFGTLQVYDTLEHLTQACSSSRDVAVSLDGGIVRGNGLISHGYREPEIIFPVVPIHSPRDMSTMKLIEENKKELEEKSSNKRKVFAGYEKAKKKFTGISSKYTKFLDDKGPYLRGLL